MEITVNGDRRRIDAGSAVADLLAAEQTEGVAVARNGTVVPRSEHARTGLTAGDVVEIVKAVQGG